MLVPLVSPSWTPEKRKVITDKAQPLADAQGQELKQPTDIVNLADGEELWLHSHGSSSTFCGVSAKALAGWLVKTMKMPAGKRMITLKGCATESYANALEEYIVHQPGYEAVKVRGFEGEASQTSSKGKMTLRRGSAKEARLAAQRGALADLAARRKLKGKKTKAEIDEAATAARKKADHGSRTYEAVLDDGLNTFVGNDDRMKRREKRDSQKLAEKEAAETSDVDSDEGMQLTD
jgi:hypothetical protein